MLARKQLSLQRLAEGVPIARIAEELNVTPRQVRTYLRSALETQSIYPTTLTPERVEELRQIQAEVLANSRQKAIQTHAAVADRIGTPEEKNMDATASARLLEAVVHSVDLEASLFGTRVPQRVQQEIYKQELQVELKQVNGRVEVIFDREQLRPFRPAPLLPEATATALNGDCSAFPVLVDRTDAETDGAPNGNGGAE